MDLVLIIIAAAMLILLYLVMPGRPRGSQRRQFQYRNIAHRGLHSKDKTVPENSLAAFEAAAQRGYGIELDVQLSRDGQVVVFHDDTLDRVTGVHGRVDAFDYAQLSEMRLCGTEQTIPLFSRVLELVDGRGPMIVELKTGPRNKELCQKTLALLRQYSGEYCIESFNPAIVAWFRRNAPDILRGQLSDSKTEFVTLSTFKGFLLSRCLSNFLARPQFIAWGPGKKNLMVRLAEGLGAMKVRWTVHPEDDPARLQEEYDTIIFEFYEPPVQW